MDTLTYIANNTFVAAQTTLQSSEPCDEAAKLLCSSLWDLAEEGSRSLAILVAVGSVVLGLRAFMQARLGGVIKNLAVGIIGAALLWDLAIITGLINIGAAGWDMVSSFLADLFGSE